MDMLPASIMQNSVRVQSWSSHSNVPSPALLDWLNGEHQSFPDPRDISGSGYESVIWCSIISSIVWDSSRPRLPVLSDVLGMLESLDDAEELGVRELVT